MVEWTGVMIEPAIFWIYVILGPMLCLLAALSMVSGRHQMRLVKRPLRPLPDPPPKVTLIIPAKDEVARIADCLRSALRQDYPNLAFIAVNDRSTDGTGQVMDQIAAEDPRLRVIHIPHGSLPPGWSGKSHALHQAVQHAEGEWLLFVDSDVILEPDAVRAAVARAAAQEYDLFSFLLRLETHSFWERLVMPLAGATLSLMFLVSLSNKDYLPRHGFANGQFLLIRRRVYDEVGGHEAIRGFLGEDVAMARRVKAAGYKTRITWGVEFAAVRMFSSLADMWRGWARNYYAPSRGSPWRILAAVAFVLLCCMSVYAAGGWGLYRLIKPAGEIDASLWLTAAAAHWVILTVGVAAVYGWSGNRRRYGLLHTLGLTVLLAILFRAVMMCMTHRVEWRGTRYEARDALAVRAEG